MESSCSHSSRISGCLRKSSDTTSGTSLLRLLVANRMTAGTNICFTRSAPQSNFPKTVFAMQSIAVCVSTFNELCSIQHVNRWVIAPGLLAHHISKGASFCKIHLLPQGSKIEVTKSLIDTLNINKLNLRHVSCVSFTSRVACLYTPLNNVEKYQLTCAQHSCTLNSCEELKMVQSKRLLQLWNLISIVRVDVHVCCCLQHSRPGRFASYSRAVLTCHYILTVSHLSGWRFRSNKLHKLSNKCLGPRRLTNTKLNKAQ